MTSLLYRDAGKIFDSVLRHDSSPGYEGISLQQFVHLYFARLPREEVEDACRKVLNPAIALHPTLDEVPGAREEIRGLNPDTHRPFLMSVTLSNHDIPLRLSSICVHLFTISTPFIACAPLKDLSLGCRYFSKLSG